MSVYGTLGAGGPQSVAVPEPAALPVFAAPSESLLLRRRRKPH